MNSKTEENSGSNDMTGGDSRPAGLEPQSTTGLKQKTSTAVNNRPVRHKIVIDMPTEEFERLSEFARDYVLGMKADALNLEKINKGLGRQGASLVEKNVALERQLRELNAQHNLLKAQYDLLLDTHNGLSDRMNKVISELAELKRDRRSHYTTSSGPQVPALVREFDLLKEQDFNRVADQAFQCIRDVNEDVKADRKGSISRLKSILSQNVFRQVQEEQIPAGVSAIAKDITTEIERRFLGGVALPEQIVSEIIELAGKCLGLVQKAASLEPPGVFWLVKHGGPFDDNQHEPTFESVNLHHVDFTVYPGFSVDEVLYSKAVVRTM